MADNVFQHDAFQDDAFQEPEGTEIIVSFTERARVLGRRPVVIVELVLDFCANTFSVAPCTATAAAGSECYNTFASCQDPANFAKTTKTYRFCTEQYVPPDSHCRPALKSISHASTRIEPSGIGDRASVTVRMADFPHIDNEGIDPYLSTRTIASTGTFFGKLRARNPHYVGRILRIKEGYIVEPWDEASFITREYIIESWRNDGDSVTIVAKDPLKLTDNDRAQCPKPSDITLDGAITNVATTVVVSDGATLSAGDRIAIDSEIITLGTKSTHTFTGCTRGVANTTAAAHSDDVKVQKCYFVSAVNVRDVIEDLIVNFAGVPSGYIPTADWDDEETASLSSFSLTATIPKPTGVKQLLQELLSQCAASMWWDEEAQKIQLKGSTPFDTILGPIYAEEAIIHETARAEDLVDQQVTRVDVLYGLRNPFEAGDQEDNYAARYIAIDAEKEGANEYNRSKVKRFASRWFLSTQQAQATLLANRILARFGNPPPLLTWEMDAVHLETYPLGSVVDVCSPARQTFTGDDDSLRVQVVQIDPIEHGHRYRYKGLSYFPASEAVISNQTIAADTANYDVFVALGGPSEPVEVTITLNAGVEVYSTTSSPSFTTGDLHPDSVVTIVLASGAKISGRGGDGGDGSSTSQISGDDGSDAINMTCELKINNAGTIAGGGGGGGNGVNDGVTSGGGGGAGRNVGVGGTGANPGSNGTATTGGGGGAQAGSGGNRGAAGAAGTQFISGFGSIPWGGGGAAGYAVRTNGHTLTWISMGTIFGPVG